VLKLQAELEREKTSKMQKKVEERALAQKVIRENQLEKAKRQEAVDKARKKDAADIEAYIQHQLDVEKKREEAIA